MQEKGTVPNGTKIAVSRCATDASDASEGMPASGHDMHAVLAVAA